MSTSERYNRLDLLLAQQGCVAVGDTSGFADFLSWFISPAPREAGQITSYLSALSSNQLEILVNHGFAMLAHERNQLTAAMEAGRPVLEGERQVAAIVLKEELLFAEAMRRGMNSSGISQRSSH
jgi:hypothetical protein